VEGRRHPREFALNLKRTILAQFALVTQAFGEFSWITLRQSAAATGSNKVEQDKTELTGASNQAGRSAAFIDELLASQHGPKAISPACGSSSFSSLTV
jgi:hypothetical protein